MPKIQNGAKMTAKISNLATISRTVRFCEKSFCKFLALLMLTYFDSKSCSAKRMVWLQSAELYLMEILMFPKQSKCHRAFASSLPSLTVSD